VPLDVSIRVQDLVADIDALKKIRDDAEDLTDDGYLQDARRLLENLASELTITTSSLPLATYPAALREAGRLIKERHGIEAALLLSQAMGTIIVEERAVPLPLIRAEAMLSAVDSLLSVSTANVEEVDLLLDNADYQISFAEALGYGKKDKEFKELHDAIKDLKKEVKDKKTSARQSNNNLRNKLNTFKTRISPKTQTKKE
jgi:hypothetical protein